MTKSANNPSSVLLQDPNNNEEFKKAISKCETNVDNETKESIASFQLKDLVWRNIFAFVILHSLFFYALYRGITAPSLNWKTPFFAWFIGTWSLIGITGGFHRMWSHRSYKAHWTLRVLLAFLGTIALQDDIYVWCRNHRVHHKFSETDADPHNSSRGFFFSHMGWLCVKKHKDVIEKGKSVDCSDLLADPVVRYQRMFYIPLVAICWGFIPWAIPVYYWDECPINSLLICVFFRYVGTLHMTWLVNSAAHLWGERPYDARIGPAESELVISTLLGEGYHNYHHTFPWDYKAAEFKWDVNANFTSLFIDSMAYLGLAYDLKTASQKMVKSKTDRSGYALPDNKYYRVYYGLIGWITSLLFTGSIVWIILGSRALYWARSD